MAEIIYHIDFRAKELTSSDVINEPVPADDQPIYRRFGKSILSRFVGPPKLHLVEDLPTPTVDEAVDIGLRAHNARANTGKPQSTMELHEVLGLNALEIHILNSLDPEDRDKAIQTIRELTWVSSPQTRKEV